MATIVATVVAVARYRPSSFVAVDDVDDVWVCTFKIIFFWIKVIS